MKLTKSNYPDAADRYLERYKARGLRMKGRTRKSDVAPAPYYEQMGLLPTHHDHAYKSKPEHAARAVPINMVNDAIAGRTQSFLDKLLGKKEDNDTE